MQRTETKMLKRNKAGGFTPPAYQDYMYKAIGITP